MRTSTVDDKQLLDRLAEVFRKHGYEGATLRLLAESSGLEKASLYHRFPKGKEEMAAAVLEHVGEWFAAQVLAPLKQEGDVKKKINLMCKKINEFYENGNKSCLLDTLSIAIHDTPFQPLIQRLLNEWINTIKQVCMEAGFKPEIAEKRAIEAVSSIQGSLVLARIFGDTTQFRRVLRRLPKELIAK